VALRIVDTQHLEVLHDDFSLSALGNRHDPHRPSKHEAVMNECFLIFIVALDALPVARY
jgi:hypothetical protein